jgi:protocatechuate 3,4-dioxygenase beta subunit
MFGKRRRFSRVLGILPTLALLPVGVFAQQPSKATPQDALGPYYPPAWSGEVDNDLIEFRGKSYSFGTQLLISGRVLSTGGKPLGSVSIEIWQTDASGKYRHPGDDGEGPAERGFQGFGRTLSDAQGRYRFRTIKPVLYGGRPPHVHFRVTAAGYRTLVTQLYFDGENTERSFFSGGFARERESLTVKPIPHQDNGRDGLAASFDLVLAEARP